MESSKSRTTMCLALMVALLTAILIVPLVSGNDVLTTWEEGYTKAAIVDFVQRVTTAGGTDFVPISGRIAVLNNKATLWSEKPMYVQPAFDLEQVKAMALERTEWKTKDPFRPSVFSLESPP